MGMAMTGVTSAAFLFQLLRLPRTAAEGCADKLERALHKSARLRHPGRKDPDSLARHKSPTSNPAMYCRDRLHHVFLARAFSPVCAEPAPWGMGATGAALG